MKEQLVPQGRACCTHPHLQLGAIRRLPWPTIHHGSHPCCSLLTPHGPVLWHGTANVPRLLLLLQQLDSSHPHTHWHVLYLTCSL